MDAPALRADCARCAALCCVAHAFDRSDSFGLDKPAGEPCPHLDDACRCRIYALRAVRGFAGCVAYDCFGAGQRVTQALFAGRSWRDEPALTAPMAEAFRVLRRVHELLALLATADKAALDPQERAALGDLRAELGPEQGWTRATLAAADVEALARRTRAFLRTLRPRFAAAR
jgi:hypothetical protein